MRLILFLFALLSASPAAAWWHGSSNSTCPFGTGLPDGCVGAPTNGIFTVASYFSVADFYARAAASGQTWPSHHPWTWNSPGVDYGIGYPSALSLADPTTASSSGSGALGVLPSNCSYQPATVSYPRVFCNMFSGPSAITINGFEFGPTGSHGCIVLEIGGKSATSSALVENSDFKNGAFSGTWTCAPAATLNFMLKVDAGQTALTILNCLFDEEYATANGNLFNSTIIHNATGALTVEYTAVVNASQRPISGTTGGPVTMSYDYFDGWVLASTSGSGQHGEIYEMGTVGTNPTLGAITYTYNVANTPIASAASTGTTTFYPNGLAGMFFNFPSVLIDHNVVTTNLVGGVGGASTISAALMETSYAQSYTSVTATNNRIDATGAVGLFCAANLGGLANLTGTIADNGGGFSTLTITAVGSQGALYAGTILKGTGVTGSPVVQAYGTSGTTGTGGTGTYIITGDQTVSTPFTNGGSVNSFIASLTQSGNVSLRTGSSVDLSGLLTGTIAASAC